MIKWIKRLRRGPRPEEASRAREPPGTQPPLEIKGRALVVDDNPINLQVALRNLTKLGCEVLTAANGREAVVSVLAHELNVVFMDVQMPVMDGFEATRTIRSREKGTGKRLPIVAMTAHSVEGYRELCVQAGMDGYITKPLRMTEMAQTLSRWIEVSWTGEVPQDAPLAAGAGATSTPSSLVRPGSTPGGVLGELDAPMLDRAQLDDATDGDSELARELLAMLFETGANSLDQADRALARGDQDEVRRAIHSLKGAAATLGAARLAQACKRVEGLRPHKLERGLEEVRAEFSALRAADP